MHLNNGLYCFFACLAAAGVIAAILAYVSLWLPVPYLLRSIFYIYLACAATGVLISVFLGPGVKSLIKTADALGLKERMVTAWQLQQEDSPIARLQRQDTWKAVSSTDFRRLYPIRFPTKLAMTLAIALVLTSISFAIPGFARETAEQIEDLQNEVDKQLEKLEKVRNELEKNEDLTEKELEKIPEEAKRLAEELKKARTEEEALKALSRTENELEKLDQQKQLHELGEALSQNNMTSELGEAVQNGNIQDMKQALEQLVQQMEQKEISPGELAEMLKQAAEQVENNEASAQLRQTAEQLAPGSPESQSGALQNLGDMLSEMMQDQGSSSLIQALGPLSQAIQQAKSGISRIDSRLAVSGQSGGGGGQAGNPSGQQGTGEGSANGSGGGATGAAGGSAGGSSGSGGGGSGKDGGGSGAGEGSTNKDAGYTGSEKSGSGRAPGESKEEAFEQLYDPDRLGGDADPTQVNGQKQDGGQSQYSQVDHIPVQKGAILPYHEVLSQYKNEAVSYMEDTEIPPAMKEIVREYFKSLE